MNTSNEQRLSSNDDLFFKDCFTEVDEDKVDAEFNNISMNCFNSKNNKFSMDSDGNLVVNSITSNEKNATGLTIDDIYPVGSVYISVTSMNPNVVFGGTWEQIKDRFLLGCGDVYENGNTGGEASHKLTINEMPAHNHSTDMEQFSIAFLPKNRISTIGNTGGVEVQPTKYTGGDQPHNNMPPYLAVYVWKRIK